MMKKKWYYILFPAICLATGAVAGLLIRRNVKEVFPTLKKPPLMPPAMAFPIVWTILYILMGWGMAMAASAGGAKAKKAGVIWAAQLALNFTWSLLFFNGNYYGAAFACLVLLWILILWMIQAFGEIRPLAGLLQVPYLLWVSFAGYLNLGVWILNSGGPGMA